MSESIWHIAGALTIAPEQAPPLLSGIVRRWAQSVVWECIHDPRPPVVWVGDARQGRAVCLRCATSTVVLDTWAETADTCAACGRTSSDIRTALVGVESVPPGAEAICIVGVCPTCEQEGEHE
ncbi:hypothetical protein ACIQLJ_08510 [Microbacterium sp. NPDC091313]